MARFGTVHPPKGLFLETFLSNFVELRYGEVRSTRECGSSVSGPPSILGCRIHLRAIHAHKSGTATQRFPQTPSGHRAHNRYQHAQDPEGTPGRVCHALSGLRALSIWDSVLFSPPRALP